MSNRHDAVFKGIIAGYEIILKYIRQKKIDGKLDMVVNHIEMYDHIVRQILIKYMSDYSDLEDEVFYDKIKDSKPNLKIDVMTVSEQWKQQGIDQGIQIGIEKGIEKGVLKKAKETAFNMLTKGYPENDIAELTGLDTLTVSELKKKSKKPPH